MPLGELYMRMGQLIFFTIGIIFAMGFLCLVLDHYWDIMWDRFEENRTAAEYQKVAKRHGRTMK